MTFSTTAHADSQAKRNVAVLVAAQSVLGSQMPMIFIVGGLAGESLATNACLATLPISLIVLGSMLAATPMSAIMQKWGRRAGFLVGASAGAVGGVVGAYGLYLGSFPVFLLGSLLTGIYMSAHGFYRFAAADTASDAFRPKAISYVMAGGLAAAIIGPQIVKLTSTAYIIPFLGTYIAIIALNVIGSVLFFFLDIPTPSKPTEDSPKGRTRLEMLKSPRIAVAVICAMVSYALMNLVMTSTPLAVVGCGYNANDAADIVTGHVLAMYVPSFFTGHLIARFGPEKIVAIGLAILAAAGLVALQGVALDNFFFALILLGIGWNFGFIGATSMLAASHNEHERGRMQGLNDLLVFGGVTLASLASGGLMNCSGGSAIEGWTAVNLAMIPMLTLAGGALLWLVLRPSAPETA
ncbi:MAG: MFS transporter [Pseudomonadota bacterium]